MKNKIAPCSLCGAVEMLTKEDVVPIWLRKEFARTNVLPGDQPPKILLPVCGSCNHRLSVALESSTSVLMKRMMSEESTIQISLAEQELLSQWVIKTDALRYVWRIKNQASSASENADADRYAALVLAFLDTGVLPTGCSVQIFRRDSRLVGSSSTALVETMHPTGSDYLHTVSRYTNFGTVSCIDLSSDQMAQMQKGRDNSRALLLWPPRGGDLAWPLRRGVSEETVSALARAGGHSSRTVVGGPYMSVIGNDGRALIPTLNGEAFRASQD